MGRGFDYRDLIIFKTGTDFKFKIGIKNKDKTRVRDLLDKNCKIYPIEETRDIKEAQEYIRLLISDYKIRDSLFYKLNELPKILRGIKRLIKQFEPRIISIKEQEIMEKKQRDRLSKYENEKNF